MIAAACCYCDGPINDGEPVRWWTELAGGEEVVILAHKFKTTCEQTREDEAAFIKELGISL